MAYSTMNRSPKIAVIAGAGPAGLTAAYELLRQTDVHPIILESTSAIGGISQTVRYHGNRMDIGGHRFFSKSEEVMRWWQEVMPMQDAPSKDALLLDKCGLKPLQSEYAQKSDNALHNPEQSDRVMLLRDRVSRIFFLRKFFDYPISMKKDTFLNMGFARTMRAGFGYLWSCVHKLPETSLENFYINRFGRPLYEMFFEGYTEKVWGVHPSELGADWGSQRVKGLSILSVLKDMFCRALGIRSKHIETSLIEQFIYPKYGPGQLWETVADDIKERGGEILLQHEVVGIKVENNQVVSVVARTADSVEHSFECDYFLSTMPIKDLIPGIRGIDVPRRVTDIATSLPYRDFITVGLCVRKLRIENKTAIPTFDHRVPDTWIYIQERDVHIGRLQVFNNWSPYLVNDYEHTMWIGLEYFCTEGDRFWTMPKEAFIEMAIDELVKIDIINREDVLDSCHVRIKKAYPAYYGSYYQLDEVKSFLDKIPNLYCLGRNGQHRYNNMDHSMLTAFECVRNIKNGVTDKTNIWNVNTEKEYHESK